MSMPGTAGATFVHMCFALAGAGVVMWGSQQMCKDVTNETIYAKCAGEKVTKTRTKEIIAKGCRAKYPSPSPKNKIIMYSGFGIIVGSVLLLWILNSGMFSGMGMGGGGGYQSQWG